MSTFNSEVLVHEETLVDVSDIFYFFLLGEGEGGVRGARKGGGRFFIENPTRGGLSRRGRGREGVCGEFGNSGGGGQNIFFRARNIHEETNGSEFGCNGRP